MAGAESRKRLRKATSHPVAKKKHGKSRATQSIVRERNSLSHESRLEPVRKNSRTFRSFACSPQFETKTDRVLSSSPHGSTLAASSDRPGDLPEQALTRFISDNQHRPIPDSPIPDGFIIKQTKAAAGEKTAEQTASETTPEPFTPPAEASTRYPSVYKEFYDQRKDLLQSDSYVFWPTEENKAMWEKNLDALKQSYKKSLTVDTQSEDVNNDDSTWNGIVAGEHVELSEANMEKWRIDREAKALAKRYVDHVASIDKYWANEPSVSSGSDYTHDDDDPDCDTLFVARTKSEKERVILDQRDQCHTWAEVGVDRPIPRPRKATVTAKARSAQRPRIVTPPAGPTEYGDVGLVNGTWWPNREALVRNGRPCSMDHDIHGMKRKGAYCIIIKGEDAMDYGYELQLYRAVSDAGTKLLVCNKKNGLPVRVFRDAGVTMPGAGYQPVVGIRFDGLYEVLEHKQFTQQHDQLRLRLVRLPGQGEILYKGRHKRPTAQEIATYNEQQHSGGHGPKWDLGVGMFRPI